MIEEKEIHLRDYYKILIKRKYAAFVFFAAIFTVILVKTLATTPLYTASAKVLIEKVSPVK